MSRLFKKRLAFFDYRSRFVWTELFFFERYAP